MQPPLLDTLTPFERRALPQVLADAVRHFRSPDMPAEAEYALLTRLGAPARPIIYRTLQDLARRILRERGTDALVLKPARLLYRGDQRKVTEVLAEDQLAGRTRRIGYAWHAGRPPETLQAALEAELPPGVVGGVVGDAVQAGRIS